MYQLTLQGNIYNQQRFFKANSNAVNGQKSNKLVNRLGKKMANWRAC